MVRESYPQVRLIENRENVGFARANNQAIAASRGQAILLLNSDAFITPGAIQQMLAVMESQSGVGIAGASLIYPDGSWQWSHGPLPTLFSEVRSLAGLDKAENWLRRRATRQSFVETGTVSGACLLARREMLEVTGLLDESFFMFNEEVDLCRRANQAGWKVVHVPGAQVVHLNGGSTGITSGRILMLYQGKRQYFAKHHGPLAAQTFFLAARLAVWAKWLAYGRKTQKAALWRSVLSGLGGM
jgi:GT2 family glycosyltransferase